MAGRGLGIAVLALLVASGVVVALGEVDEGVDLGAVVETWADVLRDADQFGLQLTRVSDHEEMELGQRLAETLLGRHRAATGWDAYVAAVGGALTAHVRRPGIRYEAHALESRAANAFAIPGGHVFVTTGMLEFLESEAELAAVLGHEIAHVDLRHCVERFQYELALARVGVRDVGRLAEVFRRVVASGYRKYQEVDADAQGVRLALEAGYDPEAGAAVFRRLGLRGGERPSPRRATPVGELTRVLGQAVGSYWRSHPPSAERWRRLERLTARNRSRLAGRSFYVGVENHRQRVPRAVREFPGERRPR